MYKKIYKSPIGDLVLTSDGEALTGLYFASSKAGVYSLKMLKMMATRYFPRLFLGLTNILKESNRFFHEN